MRDFSELEAALSNLTQIARGGQKVVYSAVGMLIAFMSSANTPNITTLLINRYG